MHLVSIAARMTWFCWYADVMYPLRVGVNWAARTFSCLNRRLATNGLGEGRHFLPKIALFEKKRNVPAAILVDEGYGKMSCLLAER